MYNEINGIDEQEYVKVDDISKGVYEYKKKSLVESPKKSYSRKEKACFVYKRCIMEPDIHFGEKVGQMLALKMGIRACDIDLYREDIPEFRRVDTGSISYFDLGSDDVFIGNGIYEYAKKNNLSNDYLPDIDMIFAAIKEVFMKYDRPYEEYKEFMQDFINMMVYDLKFGNADRLTTNWRVRRNLTTGKIDLYPIFDNEGILGFPERIPDSFDEETLVEFNEYEYPIGRKEDREKGKRVLAPDIVPYLLESYPNQMRIAIKKAYSVKVEDLIEILDNIPGLSNERREFAIKNFEYREKYLRRLVEEYVRSNKEQGNACKGEEK